MPLQLYVIQWAAEELGKLIAQTNVAILMINESNCRIRSTSDFNTYTVTATNSEWTRLCAPQCNMPFRQGFATKTLAKIYKHLKTLPFILDEQYHLLLQVVRN